MRLFALFALSGLIGFCHAVPARAQTDADVEVVLKNGARLEERGRQQLQRLLREYDLDPWIYTRSVIIESDVVPHSHPVLTLNTKYLDDDAWQLSTFLHEQVHWFIGARDEAEEAVIAELRQRYPNVPVGFPEGARTEGSTYLHLIVNWLELDAMTELIGEEQARALMARKPYYRWAFGRVLEDTEEIGALLAKHDLLIQMRD